MTQHSYQFIALRSLSNYIYICRARILIFHKPTGCFFNGFWNWTILSIFLLFSFCRFFLFFRNFWYFSLFFIFCRFFNFFTFLKFDLRLSRNIVPLPNRNCKKCIPKICCPTLCQTLNLLSNVIVSIENIWQCHYLQNKQNSKTYHKIERLPLCLYGRNYEDLQWNDSELNPEGNN